jgi:hypothetical protein
LGGQSRLVGRAGAEEVDLQRSLRVEMVEEVGLRQRNRLVVVGEEGMERDQIRIRVVLGLVEMLVLVHRVQVKVDMAVGMVGIHMHKARRQGGEFLLEGEKWDYLLVQGRRDEFHVLDCIPCCEVFAQWRKAV